MREFRVAMNQQDVSLPIRVLDDSDGTPYTSMNAATSGQEIWYQRGLLAAAVADGGSADDLSAITDAHDDWNFLHSREGVYRVDFPDAAFLEGEGYAICSINATGYTGLPVKVIIDPSLKYQGLPSSATDTTTTFPAGQAPYVGDEILVTQGTGLGQIRMITAVSGQVATHLAWDVNISASTSTVLLIAGPSQYANLDVAASVLQAQNVIIQNRLPTALTAAGNIKADVKAMNAVTVIGTGIEADKWRA